MFHVKHFGAVKTSVNEGFTGFRCDVGGCNVENFVIARSVFLPSCRHSLPNVSEFRESSLFFIQHWIFGIRSAHPRMTK